MHDRPNRPNILYIYVLKKPKVPARITEMG